jgi:hypothetical protein
MKEILTTWTGGQHGRGGRGIPGLVLGLVLVAVLCLGWEAQAQSKVYKGPINLLCTTNILSTSTDTNSAAYDVSPMYYHQIQFSSITTNVATSEVWYVQGSYDSRVGTHTTNWFNISTNTTKTNLTDLVTFTGHYKYIRLWMTNSAAKTNSAYSVGTNRAIYYGAPQY